jgi:hypothetical protein
MAGIRNALVAVALLSAATLSAAEPKVDFARDIRPILSDACFQCHGPDEARREANLRLDTRDGALTDSGNGAPFVPHDPEHSEALRRMLSTDPDEHMPPASSKKKLSAEQIKLVRTWIEQGAVWSRHWSFIPPSRPPVPAVKRADWINNPIDAFVLTRLERAELSPAQRADKVTLLRRLSLDLTGLPPTIEEVDAFLADSSTDAYAKQVERLLASPHYGERWGRHWLDAARYADSDGYEKDKSRQVWFYRDWVVDAFTRDLPYDEFIIEQIAGDLLPGATQDQIVATGYLRNSMLNEEGGVDPEQFRMEAMFDRMDAIGKSVLGLTIQCAQCHSHKFDPLTHEEYYRLFAFLNDAHEASIAVYTPAGQMQRTDLFRQIRQIEAELKQQAPHWAEQMAAWEATVPDTSSQWTVVRLDVDDISTGGQKFLPQLDGSFLAQGYSPAKNRVKFTVRVDSSPITAFRLELMNDPNLPLGGPGRSVQGTAALTEFEVEAAPAGQPGKPVKVKIAAASADIALPETPLAAIYYDKTDKRRVTGPIELAIDGKDETAWGIDAGPGRRNEPHQAVFVAEQPIEHDGGTLLTFYLSQKHGGWNNNDNQSHNLGRFRLSITSAEDPQADPLPAKVRAALRVPRQERSAEQQATIFSYWRTTVPQWREANERIEQLWQTHPEPTSQLVLQERDTPRQTHLLLRGDFLKPAALVEPGVPSFLHPLPADAAPTRLTFARWLVARQSPTTARAAVNRIWQAYWGVGLVSTSEDLGSQSESPSHPDLLDWLAVEFMQSGWSRKHLHRLIVQSAAYQQSSRVTPELLARDPDNRLLARGARFRLEAEAVRDVALAASGRLSPKFGGPSVFPPAPEFLFLPPASYGPKVWNTAVGEDRYRRSLYTFRYRSVPYPPLQNFDAPNGDFSCVRRARSNTPLQALTTLNETLFVEAARGLAHRTLREAASSDHERLEFAFRSCLARKPSAREERLLLDLLARQTEHYQSSDAQPWQLAADDPAHPPKLPADITPPEAAAWTAVARVLLNLDETITRQ